ncbi:glutaminase domain-containing protein [Roseiconus sp. JC912]
MNRTLQTCLMLASVVLGMSVTKTTSAEEAFRPPAVPLVACDPYFSVWSQSDNLWETATTHWTGKSQPMAALVRVDGHAYRLMGDSPQTIAALKQTSVRVLPTRTVYQFEGHGVSVQLTFTTPALPGDMMLLSRPTTYVNCEVSSTDDQEHDVEFYFDASGQLATNLAEQEVTGSTEKLKNATALKLGTVSQYVLGKSGDDLRIDWGYLYVAADQKANAQTSFGSSASLRESFDNAGVKGLSEQDAEFPIASDQVVAAIAMSLGKASKTSAASGYALIAYDDLYSIEFMKHRLRPYWRKDGWNAEDLINASISEHADLEARCEKFDDKLMGDLKNAGGQAYADIGALAYRQCFAAGKFVADDNGQPLQFSKENHSNGCIATSDVFYPMAPQFLLFGPSVSKSFIVPFMEYAASSRWKFPFAPHDLGTYPKANGQRYGGGETSEENQMPVEECGNLLLLFGAVAQMEGNADFAGQYWKQLSQWADYLSDKGFDPENQLCTDDFAGHMAHNVNLSAKAICALGAYAKLCEMRGESAESDKFNKVAKQYAQQWIKAARDGDHYRLAFDREGTWSQKYNLVWDRILGLDLFPSEVYETEMKYYRDIQNEFGLPLDNRSDYTKLDWVLWTATLTEDRDDFDALVQPVHHFLNETPDRSPMTDWYFTSTARKRGFTARPVVGGVFLKLLYDAKVWQSYASMDTTNAAGWADMPTPPKTENLVATAADTKATYRFTTEHPSGDWFAVDFDDSSWSEAQGGLGSRQTPSAPVGTIWNTDDVWLRRTIKLSDVSGRLALRIWHDEEAQVYVNGKLVVSLGGYTTAYDSFEIESDAFQEGDNVVAIHCHQSTGGQFIDFGIDKVVPAKK